MPETIYSQRDAFFLEIGGVDFKIREPVLWSKVETSIQRTEKHGLDVNFPSKDSQLQFSNVPDDESNNRSKQLIDSRYNQFGTDAEVILKFGQWNGITFTETTRQKLDFTKNFKMMLHTTVCKVTDIPFKKRIEDYYDAPIKMNTTTDVLGDALPGSSLTPAGINLHSQILDKSFEKTDVREILLLGVDYEMPDPQNLYYLQFRFENAVFSEGFEDFNLPNGVSEIDPTTIQKSNYQATESGKINVNSILAAVIVDTGFVANLNWTWWLYLQVGDGVKKRRIELATASGAATVGIVGVGGYFEDIEFPYVNKGDNVYIYAVLTVENNAAPASPIDLDELDFTPIFVPALGMDVNPHINITFETKSEASTALGYRLRDSIEFMFRSITGEQDKVSFAKFFDVGAPGYDFFTFNGFQIRKISGDNKFPTFSAKDAFEAIEMAFAIGENIEVDGNGDTTIVWEEVDYFYQDHEIIDLTGMTGDFVKSVNQNMSINLLKYEYPKPSVRETSSGGTIDAVNTAIDSSLPLENGTAKYRKRSKWRTEGTDIETSRRTSVLQKESVKTDDDIFLISTITEFTFNTPVSFLAAGNIMVISQPAFDNNLSRLKSFTISGTASNNGAFSYDLANVYPNALPSFVNVPLNQNLIDEASVLTTFTSIGVVSRQNEEFDKAAFVDGGGLETPTPDLYNIILQPIRVLMQHSKWTNGSAWYKMLSNPEYTTLQHINADNYRTKLNAGAVNKYGDLGAVEITPKDNVLVSDSYEGKSLITPNILSFTAELSVEQYILIQQASEGQGLTPYGYISTIDNDGNKVSGYLLSLNGNPDQNYYEIELLERGDFYG